MVSQCTPGYLVSIEGGDEYFFTDIKELYYYLNHDLRYRLYKKGKLYYSHLSANIYHCTRVIRMSNNNYHGIEFKWKEIMGHAYVSCLDNVTRFVFDVEG